MPTKQLSDLGPDGTTFGQTTADLVSLYGKTPISQRANSIQAASVVSASTFISANSSGW